MRKTGYCEHEHVSLCETLDRLLNKGAVLVGEITVSVADVDLLYLGLRLVLCSIDTANQHLRQPGAKTAGEMIL